jgi:ketosteroid isomerase-like protein
MSAENLEIARRAMDAASQRGLGEPLDVELFADLVTSDFEWFAAIREGVEGATSYRGREGFEAYLAEYREVWDEYRAVIEEYRDLGDRVLGLGRIVGRGRGSGIRLDAPMGMIFEFRGDKLSRVRTYLDQGEALRAGLSE